ncbi:D-alanyl-D-alanine carboxypeptidase family protein [Arenibaculum pallidiluteum]|uniref:D-alanyl-D-alanine carboxypeptidase family protein n=1 Tax=Arenibaculum pallidiluteum TaxID=2812559 RepID=UPI001A9701EC|nr:D-alanyl-D-alanine carboxypeptidase family protein [Arenibaculum pallidiluteum]
MKLLRFSTLVVVGLTLALGATARAATIDTAARQALLLDMTTGTVLFEKNADQKMPTSSMSKIMTMYMVFEAIKQGRLSMDDTLPVSQRAWKMQGSKMFTELGNRIKVEDLIRGVIIQSGNDASVVLAEGLSGSEEKFAEDMTARAKALGLANSNFMNATGWPHENHYSTARDLSVLAQRLIEEFPEYYHFYSEKEFTYHGIKQGNRNPLLYRDIGVDGMKTGHTEIAGYGLTASAKRGDRRLVLVVNGLNSMQARADESARLLEWGFREFDAYALYKAGQPVEEAPVWMGRDATVPATVAKDLTVTMSREERKGLKVTAKFDKPVPAPVAKGTQIGRLVIEAPNFSTREIPLIAARDVPQLGIFGRIAAATRYMVSGSVD